jgi:hypothetical protein
MAVWSWIERTVDVAKKSDVVLNQPVMLTLPFAALLASFLKAAFMASFLKDWYPACLAAAVVSLIIYWLDWANDEDTDWMKNLVFLRRAPYAAINWLVLMIILTKFATVEQLMKLG